MKYIKTKFNSKDFDAILFDFDGVLAASMDVKTEAFRMLFQKFGEDIVEKVAKHHIENGGISRYEKIKHYYIKFLGKEIDQKKVDEIADQFSQLVVEKVIHSDWINGAKEFLEKYYRILDFYVVSGTPQEELELIVKKRNMVKYFIEVCGTPATKPQISKRIIKNNNYENNRVLFIGDSLSDYKASIEADIKFLGITSEEESPFPKETWIIKDFKDIL